MSEQEPPMLPAGVLDPLRFDEANRAPTAAKRRVLARVHHTVATVPSIADEPANGLPRHPLDPTISGISRLLPHSAGRRALFIAAAFAAGGAAGAAIHAAFQKPAAERIVYVDRWIELPVYVGAPESTMVAPHSAPVPAGSAKAINVPRARSSASAAAADELSAERALLDVARQALGAGDNARAESILRAHERRFAAGKLAEEREALSIKVLAATDRADEARGKAAEFRERFPQSLFGPAVDEALDSIR
jgi:hypothetical protein